MSTVAGGCTLFSEDYVHARREALLAPLGKTAAMARCRELVVAGPALFRGEQAAS
jgi:hypothetical protein